MLDNSIESCPCFLEGGLSTSYSGACFNSSLSRSCGVRRVSWLYTACFESSGPILDGRLPFERSVCFFSMKFFGFSDASCKESVDMFKLSIFGSEVSSGPFSPLCSNFLSKEMSVWLYSSGGEALSVFWMELMMYSFKKRKL